MRVGAGGGCESGGGGARLLGAERITPGPRAHAGIQTPPGVTTTQHARLDPVTGSIGSRGCLPEHMSPMYCALFDILPMSAMTQ